jgi:FtsP/CotA-like multicopper oxidase with cupredoxin domain
MSRTQRLTFVGIAAVIAIVAVIVLVASGGSDEEEAGPTRAQSTATGTAEPAATATETAAPTATPKPLPPLVTTDAITKLRFKQGDTVRFRVRADIADEVHVHGYDLMKDIKPGQTVTFSFPADITGIFEIELENAGRQIAQLRVDPD